MMKSIALFASLINPPFDGTTYSHSVLERIAIVESGGLVVGRWVVGDRGASRGPWQMKRAAWNDVSIARKKVGSCVFSDWSANSHCLPVARLYAVDYLEILRTRFIAEFAHAPREDQLYAAWILGYRGASKHGWSTDGLPPRIQSKIDKFRATK